jgi:hypothetical protein
MPINIDRPSAENADAKKWLLAMRHAMQGFVQAPNIPSGSSFCVSFLLSSLLDVPCY